jgi:putative ABC transport system permease protein
MIRNYITVALRVLGRNRIYVLINIVCLGFALSCCMVTYVNYSYTRHFDTNHIGTDHIYRINSVRKKENTQEKWGLVPLTLPYQIERDFSRRATLARLHSLTKLVRLQETVVTQTVHYADKTFFDLFTLPLKYGSTQKFEKRVAIISDAYARKFFGNEPGLGKELVMIGPDGKDEVYLVSGILEKVPLNSSFQFNIIIPFSNLDDGNGFVSEKFVENGLITAFVSVQHDEYVPAIEKSLSRFIQPFNGAHEGWEIARFYLQPFKEIAFTSDRDFANFVESKNLQPNSRGVIVIGPAVMSLLLLLITSFNFINISIAFASSRLKEIGMRKIFGGLRRQMVKQFLTENLILSLIASAVALLTTWLVLPYLNSVTGFGLEIDFSQDPGLAIFVLILPVVTALMSGLYPALYISSFRPLSILQGKTKLGSAGRLTRVLLIAQFSISCLALVVGIIMTENASYQATADYGYDLYRIVVTQVDNEKEYSVLTQALAQNAAIERISWASHQIGAWGSAYMVKAQNLGYQAETFVAHVGGENYFQTMGLTLIGGRHFNSGEGTDTDESIIVNQAFVNSLRIDNPIGYQVQLGNKVFTIIGLVEDFKQLGLHAVVPPCALRLARLADVKYVIARGAPDDLNDIQDYARTSWSKAVGDKPYRGFLQSVVVTKEREINGGFQGIALGLSIITMVFSAAGLFALVSLNVIKRKKEIGVRKVLGATVTNLMLFINKDLIQITFISFIVGSTGGYALVSKFVFRYILVYHTNIGPLSLFIALLVVLLSCSITVGYKVFTAAIANPIDALRSE